MHFFIEFYLIALTSLDIINNFILTIKGSNMLQIYPKKTKEKYKDN